MNFKVFSRILCIILALTLVFSLVGCGEDKKDSKGSGAKFSLDSEEAVVDPDMSKFEHAVYSIKLENEVDTVIVYHESNVIYGIDQNSVADASAIGDQATIDAVIEKVEEKYNTVTNKGFVEFKVFYSEKSESLVMNMHARNLDNKENLKTLSELGIFGALSENTTYTELDETLTAMKFVKQ